MQPGMQPGSEALIDQGHGLMSCLIQGFMAQSLDGLDHLRCERRFEGQQFHCHPVQWKGATGFQKALVDIVSVNRRR